MAPLEAAFPPPFLSPFAPPPFAPPFPLPFAPPFAPPLAMHVDPIDQNRQCSLMIYRCAWLKVDYPPIDGSCPAEVDLWRSAPCFIHKYLDSALCTLASGKRNVGKGQNGWDGDTELDPGTTVYREFLKTMVQNSLDMLPSFMGLASDGIRACTNYASDDNTTCVPTVGGKCRPVQDGFTAWASLMDEVGPMLHSRDKLFSANTINGE